MKKRLLALLKIVVPIAILTWLVYGVVKNDPDAFSQLAQQQKNWPRLLGGAAMVFAAVCLTFLRWHLLVRALGLTFRVADAFRLGFLAFLLNFVSVGAVGGDLFKAVFIAREQPGKRTEAVASVVVDRVIGMFGMLLVCAVSLALVGNRLPAELRMLPWVVYGLMGTLTLGGLLLMLPGVTTGGLGRWMYNLPKIGEIIERVAASLTIYGKKRGVLAVAIAMAACVHVMFGVGIYFTASGLYQHVPSLLDHVVIVALSNAISTIPISPSGVGTYEAAMDYLYRAIGGDEVPASAGFAVALCYRAMTIVVAGIGVVYYWTSRAMVKEMREEAKELATHEDEDLAEAAHLPPPKH